MRPAKPGKIYFLVYTTGTMSVEAYCPDSRSEYIANYVGDNLPGPEMQNPKIGIADASNLTIVVPAYNEAAGIQATLWSLNALQRPVEVVVVDNGSTDSTVGVVTDIAREAQIPIELLHETQKGPVHARKRGCDFVTRVYGERKQHIIGMIDADTTVPPDWAQSVVAAFTDERTIAAGGTYTFDPRYDKVIRDIHGIDDYFSGIPKLAAFLVQKGLAKINTYGANSAIELGGYAAIGGSRQPINENGIPIKGSDVRFGDEVRRIGGKVGLIGSVTVTSPRRSIFALREGVDQASVTTMSGWVDCRIENDVDGLRIIANRLNRETFTKHIAERTRAYLLRSIWRPLCTGALSVHRLEEVLGDRIECIQGVEQLLNQRGATSEEIARNLSDKYSELFSNEVKSLVSVSR